MADDLFKVVIIGDSGVGKSNLMTRYTQNEFSTDTPSTIGVEFMTKTVKVETRDVKVQIWDTAGQERFRAISRSVYHGARGAMLVYDITSQQSFDNLGMWLQELRVHVAPNTVIFLIGNKSDLDHMRVVKKEQADRFARDNNLTFIETSALEKINVDRAFNWLVKSMHDATASAGSPGPDGRPKPKVANAAVNPGAVKLTEPVKDRGQGGQGGNKQCKC